MNLDNNKEFDYEAHIYHSLNDEKFVTCTTNLSKQKS